MLRELERPTPSSVPTRRACIDKGKLFADPVEEVLVVSPSLDYIVDNAVVAAEFMVGERHPNKIV